jgi:hypothetical protein
MVGSPAMAFVTEYVVVCCVANAYSAPLAGAVTPPRTVSEHSGTIHDDKVA